jgi:signal peptidase II
MEKRNRAPDGASIRPLALALAIIAADQASKALVMAFVSPGTIAFSALGDFFWLVSQRNLGMAFSLLDNLGGAARAWILIALPAVLVAAVLAYYFKDGGLSSLQRWALAGIAGGGVGNLIDRAFRKDGVVDFLSFKFYGIFGYDRWPTFNIADSAVVVCTILFAAATIAADLRRRP